MPNPHGVILRIVKDPVIETQFLQEDDGLAYQVWSSKRAEAFVFDTYDEADIRAQEINVLHHLDDPPAPHVYAGVVLGPHIDPRPPASSNGCLTDHDFLAPIGKQVLREELHKQRQRRQSRAEQLAAELKEQDLEELDREVLE